MSYSGSSKAVWAGLLSALVLFWPLTTYAAGNSVTITAVIRPVRIVVVDDDGSVTQILSNGPGNITPSIHEGDPGGPVAALTPAVQRQYTDIIGRVDTHKTGIIYTSNKFSRAAGLATWQTLGDLIHVCSVLLPAPRFF